MGRKFQTDQQRVSIKKARVFCAYRYVRYADDGASVYQCMDCKNTFEIRDDPAFWNFCPKCGRSWFGKFECREHYIPRWAYNQYGNDIPYGVRLHPETKTPTLRWKIESRAYYRPSPTREARVTPWAFEQYIPYRLGSWKLVAHYLQDYRAGMVESDLMNTEFRAKIYRVA